MIQHNVLLVNKNIILIVLERLINAVVLVVKIIISVFNVIKILQDQQLLALNVSMGINTHLIIVHYHRYQVARVNSPHVNNASPADHHQASNTPNASPATTHKHNSSTARQQDAPQTAQ